ERAVTRTARGRGVRRSLTMFVRADIQAALDELATLPHSAAVLSPYSFEIRPAGFRREDPAYAVIVDRTAFALRARVIPDYLATAIVAAITAGAKNNPARVERLQAALTHAGWTSDINLSTQEFRLGARLDGFAAATDDELADAGLHCATLLSEFVLDQLIV